jgi:hypothetical protein
MTDKLRITIAAAVTTLFLVAISAAGLIAHANKTLATTSVSGRATPTSIAPAASQPNIVPAWQEDQGE